MSRSIAEMRKAETTAPSAAVTGTFLIDNGARKPLGAPGRLNLSQAIDRFTKMNTVKMAKLVALASVPMSPNRAKAMAPPEIANVAATGVPVFDHTRPSCRGSAPALAIP
jgi:hypothetical protein